MAGPVVGAEVEVLVAEQAAPAGHALASVAGGAGTVDTARVYFAGVAVGALPALVTTEKVKDCYRLAVGKKVMLKSA